MTSPLSAGNLPGLLQKYSLVLENEGIIVKGATLPIVYLENIITTVQAYSQWTEFLGKGNQGI